MWVVPGPKWPCQGACSAERRLELSLASAKRAGPFLRARQVEVFVLLFDNGTFGSSMKFEKISALQFRMHALLRI